MAKRYIDADKLKEYFYCYGAITVYGDAIPAILSRIDMQPTADVVEVRHGEWIKYDRYSHIYDCSCCKNHICGKPTPYCEMCGAKMDGERKAEG